MRLIVSMLSMCLLFQGAVEASDLVREQRIAEVVPGLDVIRVDLERIARGSWAPGRQLGLGHRSSVLVVVSGR